MPPASFPYSTFLTDDLPTPKSRMFTFPVPVRARRAALPFVIGFLLTTVRHQIPRFFRRRIRSLHRIIQQRLRNDIATGDSSPNLLETILSEATLDCVKCQNELLIPLVTPCGHTVCTPCLLNLAGARRFYCPVCDSRIREEVRDLAENVTVKRLVDEKVKREGQKAWREYRDAQEVSRKALVIWTNRRRSLFELTVLRLKHWLEVHEIGWFDFHFCFLMATGGYCAGKGSRAVIEIPEQTQKQAISADMSRAQEIEVYGYYIYWCRLLPLPSDLNTACRDMNYFGISLLQHVSYDIYLKMRNERSAIAVFGTHFAGKQKHILLKRALYYIFSIT